MPLTAGPGMQGNRGAGQNCLMTPAQVRDWGWFLGPKGCALTMFRYDDEFFGRAENRAAVKTVVDSLGKLPRIACRRG